MRATKIITGATLGVAFCFAMQAQAALITHSVDGVLQNDNFEGDTVGTAPSNWFDAGSGIEAVVRDTVAAREGDQYASFETNNAKMSTVFGDKLGVLTVEFSMNIPSSGSTSDRTRLNIEEGLTGNGFVFQLRWDYTTSELEANLSGNNIGLQFQRDVWQDYKVVVDLDALLASGVQVTLDGVTQTTDKFNTGPTDQVTFWRVNGGSDFYVDAIPEPAGLALIGIGAALIALVRRRAVR